MILPLSSEHTNRMRTTHQRCASDPGIQLRYAAIGSAAPAYDPTEPLGNADTSA